MPNLLQGKQGNIGAKPRGAPLERAGAPHVGHMHPSHDCGSRIAIAGDGRYHRRDRLVGGTLGPCMGLGAWGGTQSRRRGRWTSHVHRSTSDVRRRVVLATGTARSREGRGGHSPAPRARPNGHPPAHRAVLRARAFRDTKAIKHAQSDTLRFCVSAD